MSVPARKIGETIRFMPALFMDILEIYVARRLNKSIE